LTVVERVDNFESKKLARRGMLHEFITANRDEIIERCRARISSRPAPRPTDIELEHGVPIFLDQLVESLRLALPNPSIRATAIEHGSELMLREFTIAQVVHDYGGICQTITELAVESHAPITPKEFQTLNLCLDDAIAEAVTEYSRLRAYQGTERLGRLAHELRNLLSTAVLSFDMINSGSVGVGGSTSTVLGRSLSGLGKLIDRELTEVRLGAGVIHREPIAVCEFIEDLEAGATMEAKSRGLHLSVVTVAKPVMIDADRQILASVLSNLLQNAFKFTPRGGVVVLRARTNLDRVLIDVEDQCGGLPPGKAEELFQPFEQRGADRSGLGLGLQICHRGVAANDGVLSVVDRPGIGCVFTVDLPKR
jgi:signal transduction histidine kinase